MNRIDKKLQQLKAENKKALITYVTCGDGGYDTTESAVLKMAENGADIIELGVPFSPTRWKYDDEKLRESLDYHGVLDVVKERVLARCRKISAEENLTDEKKLLTRCFNTQPRRTGNPPRH